jgi:hypothetical protein
MFQRPSFKVETMTALALIGSGEQSPENVMVGGEAAKWHSREWQKPLVVTSESCDSRKLGLTSTVFQLSFCLLASAQYDCHVTKLDSASRSGAAAVTAPIFEDDQRCKYISNSVKKLAAWTHIARQRHLSFDCLSNEHSAEIHNQYLQQVLITMTVPKLSCR